MKSLILYGAFDRYNYGDNLMPIVIHQFILKNYPKLARSYKITFSAMFESNLVHYKCYPTTSIADDIKDAKPGSSVIVVGGETLTSQSLNLYSYTISNRRVSKIVRKLTPFDSLLSSPLGRALSGIPYEFPYTPSSKVIGKDIDFYFNAVGGKLPQVRWKREILKRRLADARYVSVRDDRGNDISKEINSVVKISPDSVSAVANILDDDFIESKVSKELRYLKGEDYFVFQAAPHKIGATAKQVANALISAALQSAVPFILLPIGYASGHDDRDFLREVSNLTGFKILDDLNVFEILYVLKYTRCYFGTSLHGAITALSYSKPHFPLGDVPKLSAYLRKWSVPIFAEPVRLTDIALLSLMDFSEFHQDLMAASSNTSECAILNIRSILDDISVGIQGQDS